MIMFDLGVCLVFVYCRVLLTCGRTRKVLAIASFYCDCVKWIAVEMLFLHKTVKLNPCMQTLYYLTACWTGLETLFAISNVHDWHDNNLFSYYFDERAKIAAAVKQTNGLRTFII